MNATNRIVRFAALPILSAGVIGGAALGLAGTAAAQGPVGSGNVYSPDTYATPAPTIMPGWHNHHGPLRIAVLQNR
ncbi:hypothetical protein M1247_03535 [Mycobacterium sp. 21AC1]|uniref:hypothetical protein n=1 Tax=[Mycobacterium] appelbergii TaxID=2939269 RepID=UPI002938F10F|nr:hypothetical protein [Mycobacterium sp. 21AC1]MDV3123976.1 hypothetical protein [Mycobacterium sp. 21AC1]